VFSTYYTAAATQQRQHELKMKAEAHRLARLARSARLGTRSGTASPGRPAGERVVLPDGSAVVVRPVQPADQALLADGFHRLSVTSRRHRFLTVKRDLSTAELQFLTDVDHHDHEAIGALDSRGRGVGVARYIRSAPGSQDAELAVTIVDEWQRRGVGTVLLARLTARARQAGVFAFQALVSADNEAMISLLRKAKSGVELIHIDVDTVEYEISLAPFARSLAAFG
jgi:GNAT superfamily N-acetyltransferase